MPPQWFTTVTPADVAVWLFIMSVVGGILVGVWKVFAPIHSMYEVIAGRPEKNGLPKIPSITERLDKQDARFTDQDVKFGSVNETLKEIRRHVTPNHGSTKSLAEELYELAQTVNSLVAKVDHHVEVEVDQVVQKTIAEGLSLARKEAREMIDQKFAEWEERHE